MSALIKRIIILIIIVGIISIVSGIAINLINKEETLISSTKEETKTKKTYSYLGVEYSNISIIKREAETKFKVSVKNVGPIDYPPQEFKITILSSDKKEKIWETKITIPELKRNEKKELEYDYLGEKIPSEYEIEINEIIQGAATD